MKTYMKILFIASMLLALTFLAHARKLQNLDDSPEASSGYTLIERRGDIALYERWFVLDSGNIKAREIKVVFDVKAQMQPTLNMLRDESNSSKWNAQASAFRIVRQGSQQWITYIRYDLPWPFSDHDCVLKYNLDSQSTAACIISFQSGAHSAFPSRTNISRLSNIKGEWRLTQHRESIHIEYVVTTTPSSTLPRWVTDPIIRNNLLDMMVKFSALLETLNNKS